LLLDVDGKNMAVAGEAGQGKTTAISLLWESLKVVGDPVTHGEKKGSIKITLGDGNTKAFVTRQLTAKTSPITIQTSEGDTVSAKEFASWFCDLGDNPHRIMDMKPKEQAQALLKAVKLPDGVDLDKLDAERDIAAAERLDLKRDGERAAKALGAEPEKTERVDLDELIKRQNEASESNAERVKADADLSFAEQNLARLRELSIQKGNELKAAQTALDKAMSTEASQSLEVDKIKSDLEVMAPAIETADIQQEIQDGNNSNTKADQWDSWNKENQALIKLRDEWHDKNDEVKGLDDAKKNALGAAIWPLDGLSVEDGAILFNGSQLAQCGHSEQMLVCGALAAETIKNHKLHVVRMDGIESMSQKDFKRLEKIFNDKGIQVLSSRVTRGDIDDGEILIVDGAIEQ
ncbi:MAG: hypothetical protein KAT71_08375, partial [Gammaproteobacteria bacterium]|nr:hypothetical protein [Gammaproteobacteria bacterium]